MLVVARASLFELRCLFNCVGTADDLILIRALLVFVCSSLFRAAAEPDPQLLAKIDELTQARRKRDMF